MDYSQLMQPFDYFGFISKSVLMALVFGPCWYAVCYLICRKKEKAFRAAMCAPENESSLSLDRQIYGASRRLSMEMRGSPTDQLFFHSLGFAMLALLVCVVFKLSTSPAFPI